MTHSDRRGAKLFYAALEKGDAEALVGTTAATSRW
jgi:hypothetical protein